MKAILATLLLACSPTTPPQTTVRKDAAMTAAQSPAGDKHPGERVFEDKIENSTHTDAGWVAVVKIVITGSGQLREMTTYGPNDRFLTTTTATLGPPNE